MLFLQKCEYLWSFKTYIPTNYTVEICAHTLAMSQDSDEEEVFLPVSEPTTPYLKVASKLDSENLKKRKSSVLNTSKESDLSGSTGAAEKRKMATGGTNPPVSITPNILAANALRPTLEPEVLTPNPEEFDKIISDIGLDKNLDINSGAAGTSFAAKAKKAKRSYPFALYILAGSEDRESLTKPHYMAWEEFIFSTRIKMPRQENSMLKIDFTLFRGNYGLMACADKSTAKWIQNQTKAFKFEEKNTRAWARWENEQAWIFSVFVHSLCFKDPKCKPNWLVGQILTQNGLNGDFRNATIDKKPKDGVFLSFEPISQELIQKLNSMQRLDCILGNSIIEKRIRKSRTEAEFLEMLSKNPNSKV